MPAMTREELHRYRLLVVAGMASYKAARDRDARRSGARLRIRSRCRAYFDSLLDQHRQTGAILTVTPLPVTRRP